jgi:MFS superfamily sulfate permease-like transporter
MLLRRGSRPYIAFLGRIPGTDKFSDIARHPENEKLPNSLIFRVYADVLYFNAVFIQEVVLQRLESEQEPVKHVVWDLSSSPNMDVPGARSVRALHQKLKERGVELRLAETTSFERDILRGEHVDAAVGEISRFATVQSAIDQVSMRDTEP